MKICSLAIAAALALTVTAALPAQADNCTVLQDHYREMVSDRDAALKEGARVNERDRAKPANTMSEPDHAYCIALRQTMDDVLLLSILNTDGCFASGDAGVTNFKAEIDKIGHAAATLSGFYCTKADLQAPLRKRY